MTDETRQLEEWLPSRIFLIDRSPALVAAWSKSFASIPDVTAIAGDYFQQPADAIVSPANSFGYMDGGLDLAIREELGYGIQVRVQSAIIARHHSELPIGAAEIVETGDPRWKYLIAAPTMRVPENVENTLNAYMAFRAILVAAENFNKASGTRLIDSLVCSGLGTGIGGMPPVKCAGQMYLAYKSIVLHSVIGGFEAIHRFHRELRSL